MSPATATIDFGSSHTVAVVSAPGTPARLVTLDGEPWMPSAVFLDRDGRLVAGRDALRLAEAEPARLESRPKARIDEQEVLLGDTVVPVVALIRAVLAAAVEAARQLVGPVQQLVLTHPADWGSARLGTLLAAAQGLAPRTSTVAEPVGAAAWFSARSPLAPGQPLGVLDFGGGTCDAAVVRRAESGGLEVLATGGLPDLGGQDLDQRLVDHLRAAVPGLSEYLGGGGIPGRGGASLRELTAFRTDVRQAKELLSRHPQAEIVLPGELPDALVTRAEFDGLIRPDVLRAAELIRDVIGSAGAAPGAIQLAGGSARIPLLARAVGEVTGIAVRLDDQPEAVVALGAHRVVTEPERRPAPPPSAPQPVAVRQPASGPQPVARPAPVSGPQPILATEPPPPGRRRAAVATLAVGAVALVAAVVAGLVLWPVTVGGQAGPTSERLALPPAAPGNELVTQGRPTDGLVPAQVGVPTEVVYGGFDVDFVVNAVTDPATDKLNSVGANSTGEDGRWVLLDTTIKARSPAKPPYFTKDIFLVDDRGLFIRPLIDASLPSDCPLQTPATLEAGQEARQCYAFLLSAVTPVTAVAIAGSTQGHPGMRQHGILVPVTGARVTGEPKPAPTRIPLGTVRMVTVDGVPVRVAVVDTVRTPSAYFDYEPISLPGSTGVLLRMVAETDEPVDLTRLLGGVLLRDDRRQYLAGSHYSSANGCTAVKDGNGQPVKNKGRLTLCLLFALPTGMPLGSVLWSGTGDGNPHVWGL
ncbi:Hsp70 family protein [Amycolatopsis anabasis]|uniref:Hsp70 family protein n=1 Tax=Amycolatopsis anabasis TaxID=1840409 RepID=UPI00131DE4E1|nr:Hsp70 family protein [Amycolatopsis anabasis]